ncbi:MAG: DUF4232 domain-containing protein [Actinomycetota bacterium]|nr:DUF4232 domain-containing protein [Actinomycetota bacterium]
MPVRTTTAALCAAVLALLAGCTQASQSKADDPVVSTSPSTPASSTPPASQSSPASAPPSTSSPASRTPAPPSTSTSPIVGAGCPTSALKVAVLRASGAAGHQYAFLQFTNISAKSCSLTGFPGVQLLRGGAPLGQPAARSAIAVTTVPIAPGAAVTARLVDDSTCQADNADSVQVFPPNQTDRILLPISLRGCPLHVDPVTAS